MRSSDGNEYEDSDLVLNFNDAVIYGADLALLRNRTAWLNDACIHFFLEWTKAKEFVNADINMQYLDPAVASFFVHQCVAQDEIDDFLSTLCLQFPCKLFIPINDSMIESTSWQSRAGNHWSLLVVAMQSESTISFWHFDSVMHSGNMDAADTILRKLAKYRFGMDSPVLIAAKTPLQSNDYDCGVHLIEAVHVFARTKAMDLHTHVEELKRHVHDRPNFAHERRQATAQQIIKLAHASK